METIVAWQDRRPKWGMNKDQIIKMMTHPVNMNIYGIDATGRLVPKERIKEGNSTRNVPFTVNWQLDEINPELIDRPQVIFGDVEDFDPTSLVPKPVWEVWILSEAPTEWPIGTPAPPPPPPIEDPEKVQAILDKYRQSLVTIEDVKGVGKVVGARIKEHFERK